MKKNYIAIFTMLLFLGFSGCKDDKKSGDTDNTTEISQTGNSSTAENEIKVVAPNGDTLVKNSEGKIVRTITKTGEIVEAQEIAKVVASERPYYIHGTLVDGAGANITLDMMLINKVKPLYVQTANKEGRFDFEGTTSEPKLMQLRLPAGNVQFIVKPGDTVNLEMNLQTSETYTVKGSPESLHLKQMYEILMNSNEKKHIIDDRIKATSDKRLLKELYLMKPAQFEAIDEVKFAELKKLITKIDTSFTAILASLYLRPDKNIEFLEKLDQKFANLYPQNEFYKALHEKVVIYAPIAMGKIAPEIMSQTKEGATFRLSSLRGKYVLIDFWASWCAPCRQENPNVKKVYEKYKNKGFEIVSVSLDKDPELWKKAIADDKMTWIQVSDLLEYKSAAAQTYIITAIPTTYLLDKEGRIIAKNLRGNELEKKLAQVFK